MEGKKRCGTMSQEQKSMLIHYLNNSPQLLCGKFTNEFTFKSAQNMWEDISNKLNSIPGAKKDWRQWRKTWQDIKTSVKSKNAAKNKDYNSTGGGGPSSNGDEMTEVDNMILNLIKPVCSNGHSSVAESKVQFDFTTSTEDVDETQIKQVQNEEENFHLQINEINTPKKSGLAQKKHSKATADAAEALVRTSETKLAMKEIYYEKKIEILERMATAKEKKNKLIEESTQVLKDIKDILYELT